MNKFQVLKQMRYNSDSILTLKGEDAILATTDFSEKYIRRKKMGKLTITKNCILVFSWTDDKFRNVDVNSILSIKALNLILNNKSPDLKENKYEE